MIEHVVLTLAFIIESISNHFTEPALALLGLFKPQILLLGILSEFLFNQVVKSCVANNWLRPVCIQAHVKLTLCQFCLYYLP